MAARKVAERLRKLRIASTAGLSGDIRAICRGGSRLKRNSEIQEQMKRLPIREAMWLLDQESKKALALIVEAARSALFCRPWLGALRRIWIGARS